MSNIVCFMLGNSNVTINYIDSQNSRTIFFNDIKDPINIIYEISLLPVNCLKAAIVCFYGENIEYKSEIAKHLEFYYSRHQIPVFCCSWNSIFISSTLLAAVNKHGYGILDEKMDFIFCEENSVTKFHVIKCENKYLIHDIINGSPNRIQIADNKKLFISCLHRNSPITNGQRYIKERKSSGTFNAKRSY
uniref:Uncharacterized protein n=1 Tax=Panagrolaimus davidi TaxID=227884 RepID=A0A914PDY9_9BILA